MLRCDAEASFPAVMDSITVLMITHDMCLVDSNLEHAIVLASGKKLSMAAQIIYSKLPKYAKTFHWTETGIILLLFFITFAAWLLYWDRVIL